MVKSVEAEIKERGLKLGFSDVRITRADITSSRQRGYAEFIENGMHGEMSWLAYEPERRSSPRKLWVEANTIIVCALNYGPSTDPLAVLNLPQKGGISVYAQNRDYHEIIKGKLKEMAGLLARRTQCEVKVFVDTAPILEKPLAEQAGIGWQGKHTNLVSRHHGSWLFLGEIFTSAKLETDLAESDHCGACTRCLDVCPTQAFPRAYQLDARRCIAYLTIEHKSPIPHEFRQAIGNRIYGCDDCLAVCPWNKFASASNEIKLQGKRENIAPDLRDLLKLDDQAFRQRFGGSPVKRIGRDCFLRNVLIACGNSGDKTLIDPVKPLASDPSALVRGAAIWALSRLLNADDFRALRTQSLIYEDHKDVRHEWEMGI